MPMKKPAGTINRRAAATHTAVADPEKKLT
jgi:hypothetical protein